MKQLKEILYHLGIQITGGGGEGFFLNQNQEAVDLIDTSD